MPEAKITTSVEQTPPTSSTTTTSSKPLLSQATTFAKNFLELATPLGFVEQACELVQEAPGQLIKLLPSAPVYSKKLGKKISQVEGIFAVSNLACDLLKLDRKIISESPRKTAKLILSIFKNFTKSLNWSESMGMLSLSDRVSNHFNVLSLVNDVIGSYIQVLENFMGSTSLKKHLKGDFKALTATLKACQYFLQNKVLKGYLKPITAATDLVNDSLELYENIQKIMKGKYKESGKEMSLKMCQSLTSIGLSVILLATFYYGEAFALPALAFAFSSMNFGSEVALYAMS